MIRTTIALLSAFVIGGCTTPFSCGTFPRSGCKPVSEVYDNTNDGYYDYRKRGKLSEDARSYEFASNGQSSKRAPREIDVKVASARQRLSYMPPGAPLLSKPVVMRILVNSWIDDDNDLNAGGFIFVRLKESVWYNN